MKYSQKMRLKKSVSAVLAASMAASVFTAVPVYAETSSATYTYDGYKVDYTVTNEWFGNQNVNVTLTNTSSESILNWALGYDANGEISGIWNGYVYSKFDEDYIIKNAGYNYEIEPYQSVNFGYTLSGDELEVPENFELCSKRVDKTEGYDVKLNVTGDWGDSFQAELIVTNTSDAPLEAWKVDFDSNFEIGNLWNGKIIESDDDGYSVASCMWTNPIVSGEFTSIGFTASKETSEAPTVSNITLSEVIIDRSGSAPSDDPINPSEDELNIIADAQYIENDGTAVISWNTNVNNGTFEVMYSEDNVEYTQIASVSDAKTYTYALGETCGTVYFKVRQTTEGGQVAESSAVSVDIPVPVVPEKPVVDVSAEYDPETGYIVVSWETSVDGGTFDIYVSVDGGDFSKIGSVSDATAFSFVPEVSGSYDIKVVQTTASGMTGESSVVNVVCTIPDPADDIDWEDPTDTDNDGLTDVYEKHYFETDSENADTDGDGLPDGYEVFYLGTNPKKSDSDDNGVSDGEEDFDKDGLNNQREYELGTDPNNADTDSDELTDNDEVSKYKTDPLKYDTDEDGISDGDEIALRLDPTSASTDGTPDSERTFVQHIGADSENLSAVNTEENPFKVSIDITAAGVAGNNLSARESGYSNAIKNDAVLGVSPEFVYTDGLKVEDVVINFDISDSAVNNTNGKYTSLSDEFVGIKRLNVFKFFEDTNMLLPIETFHDVENSRVYTHVDELGTYCLMDMEVWLENLGIEASSDSTVSVNVSDAKSHDASEGENVVTQSEEEQKECLDIVMVVYPNESLLDLVKSELVSTSKKIFDKASQEEKDCRIYYVTFLGESIVSSTGNIYAENLSKAQELIVRYPGINTSHASSTYPMYRALNYVKNSCLPEFRENSTRYCFVIDACGYPIASTDIGAVPMMAEKNVNVCFSYNRGNPNELTYQFLSSICEQALIEVGRYNFGDFVYSQIFTDRENEYPIISAVGWKRVKLDAPITVECRDKSFVIDNDPSLRDSIVNTNKFADTDKDGLLDLEEIMFQTEKGNDLITFDDSGKVVLPNFEDCISKLLCNNSIFYVEKGLQRYADVAHFQDFFKFRVLPIKSDPTNSDDDYDGISDFNDTLPLSNNIICEFKHLNTIKETDYTTYDVTFQSDFTKFLNDNSTFDSELATHSIIISGLCYSGTGAFFEDNMKSNDYYEIMPDGLTKTLNITEYMDFIGFENIVEIDLRYNDDGYDYNDNNVAHFYIGRKHIEYQGRETDLVAVFIRGTTGIKEWLSNFDIGQSNDERFIDERNDYDNHLGFDVTSFRIIQAINDYLNSYHLNDPTKTTLWITGHSRGAAISNIVASEYCGIGYKTFSYTFATPNTTVKNSESELKCSGIFNIVNEFDFVPALPLENKWGFSKYGTTYTSELNGHQKYQWEFRMHRAYSSPSSLTNLLSGFECLADDRDACYHVKEFGEFGYAYLPVENNDTELEATMRFISRFPLECRDFIKVKCNKVHNQDDPDITEWQITYSASPFVTMCHFGLLLGGDKSFSLTTTAQNIISLDKIPVLLAVSDDFYIIENIPNIVMGGLKYPHYIDTYYHITRGLVV